MLRRIPAPENHPDGRAVASIAICIAGEGAPGSGALVGQARQALANGVAILAEAGGRPLSFLEILTTLGCIDVFP